MTIQFTQEICILCLQSTNFTPQVKEARNRKQEIEKFYSNRIR